MNWISVVDGFPAMFNRVLAVTTEVGVDIVTRTHTNAFINDGLLERHVTHWAPLPNPPQHTLHTYRPNVIQLPVVVGDTIWVLYDAHTVAERKVCEIRTNGDDWFGVYTSSDSGDYLKYNIPFSFRNLDKTVFLDKEQAEQALKELEKK